MNTEAKYCPKCGSPIKGTEKFCAKCGNRLMSAEDKHVTPKEYPAAPRSDRRRRIIIAASVAAVCVAGGLATFSVMRGSDAGEEVVSAGTLAAIDEAAVRAAELAREDSLRRDSVKRAEINLKLYNSYKEILQSRPDEGYMVTDIDHDGVNELWVTFTDPDDEMGYDISEVYVADAEGNPKCISKNELPGTCEVYKFPDYVLLLDDYRGAFTITKYTISSGKLKSEEVYDANVFTEEVSLSKGSYAEQITNGPFDAKPNDKISTSNLGPLRKAFGIE